MKYLHLKKSAKLLLQKARESALLAVDVYNKPSTSFRSGGCIVLLCIAWTSLLHAVFEQEKKKYFWKKPNGRYELKDGERKSWELIKSAEEYFDSNSPILKNIEFFVLLRNKIEHRFMPAIDSVVSSELQALILNFEDTIVECFGPKYSLIEHLFLPLQLTQEIRVIPKSKHDSSVLNFISTFRKNLSRDISGSQHYAFKAFLVPKIGNHRSSSDATIEFIKDIDDSEEYSNMVSFLREKTIPVANQGKYRPKKVLEILNQRGVTLDMTGHTLMWKKHNVRPSGNSSSPKDCSVKYCQFDEASTQGDYLYTDEWIELLVRELKSSGS